ncbi:MAG: hypothetical protein K2O67_05625 [Clostridia bacterium]|nr:hypothetical protein [Clostridia bacterium]
MKRLTALLFILMITLSAAAATPVYAAPATYARAAVEDAYFFNDKSTSSSLFAVPYTYCIEVLREEGDWYYARYAQDIGIYRAVYGYCRKQDFTLESGVPEVTYLYKTVTVNYSVPGSNPSLPVLSEIAVEAAYYGTYYAGATVYSYVYCQGSFGYIEGAYKDYDLNLPPEEEPTGGDAPNGDGTKPAAVNVGLIIVGVIFAVAAGVIIIIHFTTKRPRIDG